MNGMIISFAFVDAPLHKEKLKFIKMIMFTIDKNSFDIMTWAFLHTSYIANLTKFS
jgi:hypothetical protein